jgi:hypothetical protein
MAKSPSQAKNAIERCLRGIVDPYPSKTAVGLLWACFDSRCAYCGKAISRAKREGHMDHLVSFKDGGANDIGNHVLACKECNGNEKREENWEAFLRRKNPDEGKFLARKANIEEWVARNAGSRRHIPEDQRAAVLTAYRRLAAELDAAVSHLRTIRTPKPKREETSRRARTRQGVKR